MYARQGRRSHRGGARPLFHRGRPVLVDGHPICATCGAPVRPVGMEGWRHATDAADRARWAPPVTLRALRATETYEEFRSRFAWTVRPDVVGSAITSADDWREARDRLERYDARLGEVTRRPRLPAGANPLLELARTLAGTIDARSGRSRDDPIPDDLIEWSVTPGLARLLDLGARRRELSARFAWAIPNAAALDLVARSSPIVEGGAGTGYWAALLRRRGVDVVAYDIAPASAAPGNRYDGDAHAPWTDVAQGPSADAVRRHRDRTLFLCWPPYGDDAASYKVLRAYRGDVLVYAGGPEGQAAGSVRFHRELALNWTPIDAVDLPSWPGVADRLTVLRRNPERRAHAERDRCFECGRFLPTGAIGRCDACFSARPAPVVLRVGDDRLEYPQEILDVMPVALRLALERSPRRVR